MDAVIGAYGTAGTECVKRLLALGRSVCAIDFNDEILKHPERFGEAPVGKLRLVQADATDAKSISPYLEGVEGLILAFQGGGYLSAGKVDHGGVKVVAAAAAKAGVKRVVLISSLLVTEQHKHHPLRMMLNAIRFQMMSNKLKGEARLRESGVSYCIIRPGRFVEKADGSAVKLNADQGDKINGSICPRDVAAICAAALTDPAANGVTFEVVDEWAKSPEAGKDDTAAAATQEAAPEPAGVAPDTAAGGGGESAAGTAGTAAAGTQHISVDTQLQGLFSGLKSDAAIASGGAVADAVEEGIQKLKVQQE